MSSPVIMIDRPGRYGSHLSALPSAPHAPSFAYLQPTALHPCSRVEWLAGAPHRWQPIRYFALRFLQPNPLRSPLIMPSSTTLVREPSLLKLATAPNTTSGMAYFRLLTRHASAICGVALGTLLKLSSGRPYQLQQDSWKRSLGHLVLPGCASTRLACPVAQPLRRRPGFPIGT